jgi:hypothetical protein
MSPNCGQTLLKKLHSSLCVCLLFHHHGVVVFGKAVGSWQVNGSVSKKEVSKLNAERRQYQ